MSRVKKSLQVLKNGFKYEGEYLRGTNIRDGRGIQIWTDGSRYDGYWKLNKACGKGRLLHYEGDVYDGEWANDMANGFGYYFHADGSWY